MISSVTGKYISDSGIELPNAFIVFKRVSIFSHTVTTEDASIETRDVEFSFNVYVSESAYDNGKPQFETFTKIAALDSDKTMDEQVTMILNMFV